MKQQIHLPLALTGAENVRELGGYRTTDGKTIRTHRLLRGTAQDSLTDEDRAFLYDYGVRCIIDLRSSYEGKEKPSRMEGYKDVAYYNVPMLDEINSKTPEEMKKGMPSSIFEIYKGLILDERAGFKRVLDIISDHPTGCILFNCAAGKDRTGLTAMLLLSIAGVDEETIVDDYVASERFLPEFIKRRKAEMEALELEWEESFFGTAPENMEQTLALIKQEFGTVHDYLLQIGIERAQIDKIRRSLWES